MPLVLSSDDFGKLLLRVTIAGLLLFHGIHKLLNGIGGIEQTLTDKGLPGFIAYGVYVGEVLAPILVIIGFKCRAAAAVIAFNMAVAIGLRHMGDLTKLGGAGAWGVELQMLFLLGAVAIAFLGSGRYSISRGRGALD